MVEVYGMWPATITLHDRKRNHMDQFSLISLARYNTEYNLTFLFDVRKLLLQIKRNPFRYGDEETRIWWLLRERERVKEKGGRSA